MSKETFDFSEALRRMKEGKKVNRKVAIERIDYIILIGKNFYAKRKGVDNLIYTTFSPNDILATDWEEVEG